MSAAADKDNLFGTGLSIEWIHEQLEKSCGGKNGMKSWQAELVGVGMGYLSDLFKVTFEWEHSTKGFPASVVVKVPTMGKGDEEMAKAAEAAGTGEAFDNKELEEQFAAMLGPFHSNECNSYDWLQKHQVQLARGTKFYSQDVTSDQKGVLIMENFAGRAHVVNLADGLNVSQIKSVLDSIASLQAKSIKTDDWQEKLNPFDMSMMKTIPDMFQHIKEQLKSMRPEYFTEIDKLDDMLKSMSFWEETNDSAKKLGIAPVFVHGDLWTNNMLFSDENPDKLLALIDWQLANPGSCASDLSRLLISSVDGTLRRRETDNLLRYFHDKLRENLGAPPPYSLDLLKKAYNAFMPISMAFFLLPLTMMIQSPFVAEQADKEQKTENLLSRGKLVVEDVLALTGKGSSTHF